ncbi:MAG TPA: CPBP family intramembrane glutamic endopeptidase [bacterium]|nr:CPBP family intramembrane glutamic endopeptidase [bacterium]
MVFSYSLDALLPLIAGLLGSAALALRPPATVASLAITLATGVIGAATPPPRSPREDQHRRLPWLAAAGIGIAAFAAARLLQHPMAPKMAPLLVAATAVAGIAEELLFRRLLYGALAVWGAALAVGGSAVIFAAVHVPAYGVAAFPIDLAAGLVFGWQRWASGTWTASAVTHAAANVLQAAC